MASYLTRLYKDTGFSPENIPDSGELLNSCTFIDVDAIWAYQNQETGSIRIKTNFENIYGVDYCKIGTDKPAYYFVNNVTMINPVTAQLDLQIDAITTIGLNKIINNLAGGWCIRRHVNNDALFSNNIQENFSPAEPLVIDFRPFVSKISNEIIIASSVDLDKIDFIAKTFKDSENSLSVTVPQMPTITKGTLVNIRTNNSKTYTKRLPCIKLYNYNADPDRYSTALSTLWSLGMIDSITNIYNISGNTSFIYDGDAGAINTITFDGTDIDTDSNIPIRWNINVNNNKVFCDQFNKVNVASFSSGDSLDYNPSDITRSTDNSFQFVYWHDPSPSGKTYIRPIVFQGLDCSTDAIFFQCVSGSIWPNTQVIFESREGWAVNQKLYATEYEKAGYAGFFNLLSGASNIGKMFVNSVKPTGTVNTWGTSNSIATPDVVASRQFINFGTAQTGNYIPNQSGLSGLIGNIQTGINLSISKRQNRINYISQNSLVSPTIKFPRDNTLIELIGNGFFIIRSRLSDNDSKRFDRYLTEYGYAVNEPLTSDCFSGRQYFNYIEATDITIKAIDDIPLRLKQLAIEQLEGGVRIWHVLVNSSAFDNNPIVGG